MGQSCCGNRDHQHEPQSPLLVSPICLDPSDPLKNLDIAVSQRHGPSGSITLAERDFGKDEVVLQERARLLVYPSRDPPWRAALRSELKKVSSDCAWQYCMAVHLLRPHELPLLLPEDFEPLPDADWRLISQLCCDSPADDQQPSELAEITARHLAKLGGPTYEPPSGSLEALARRIDTEASRCARNAFELPDMSARPPTSCDALFYRISFLNHCCGGGNTASWTWSGGKDNILTVRTTTPVAASEELTISYIGKPWSEMGHLARRKYIKQNYGFDCLCKVCAQGCKSEKDGPSTPVKSEGQSRLAQLLSRWIKDDPGPSGSSPDSPEAPTIGAPSASTSTTAEEPEAAAPRMKPLVEPATTAKKAPLTEEGRLERVQARLSSDGLSKVPSEEILAVLREEGGHVGKTVIRLGRKYRQLFQ